MSEITPATPHYTLRPATAVLLSLSTALGGAAFLITAYVLLPYVAGPYDEALWWRIHGTLLILAALTGLAGLVLVRQDQRAAEPTAATRLRQWRMLSFAATGGYLLSYLVLSLVLGPGAPLWFALAADVAAALLALLVLAACYYAPIGHWWELTYALGSLLTLIAAMAFWFPAIDGIYGAFLFAFILYKFFRNGAWRGLLHKPAPLSWLRFLTGYTRVLGTRAARQHELLHGLMLVLAVLPLGLMFAIRPWFQPWNEEALDVFAYVMIAGTLCLYTAPLLCSGALLFWCRHYQALSPEARAHFVIRRQHLALALLGLASYIGAAGYYFGQVTRGPLAYVALSLVFLAVLLSLASRRRLLLLLPVLPIAVAVSLKKLNYIGDFLLPLYVGIPIGQ